MTGEATEGARPDQSYAVTAKRGEATEGAGPDQSYAVTAKRGASEGELGAEDLLVRGS